MIVNVQLTDGRTTFQFASRADLRKVLNREPDTEDRAVAAWAKWNPEEPQWVQLRACYLRKHSIAFTVNARDVAESDDDLPSKDTADERARRWESADQEAATA